MAQRISKQKFLNRIRGYFKLQGPKSKKEEQEYGPGKTDVLVCDQCQAFYWHKSWHYKLDDYPELNEKKRIKFAICPACEMIKNNKYEGEVLIKNSPNEYKEGIKKLAENYGQRAFENDPMDRVISIKENGLVIEIKTTENQLAQRLAKKISESFRGKFNLSINHSNREDVIRATLTFKEK